MPLLVSDITPLAAADLNDAAQITYTNTLLLPYVKMAWERLKLKLQVNGALRINEKSANLTVNIGDTDLFGSGVQPSGLLEPLNIYERLFGSTQIADFMPMTRQAWEPNVQATDSLRYWTWRKQHIITPGATTKREVFIQYQMALIEISSPSDTLDVNNCMLFMSKQTASYTARYAGNNKSRSDDLKAEANEYLWDLLGINARSKQATRARRKPARVRKHVNYFS